MIKTLQQAPFLRLSLFYIFGILCGNFVEFNRSYEAAILLFSCFLMFLSLFVHSYNRRWLFGFALFLFCFVLGIISLNWESKKTEWAYAGWNDYSVEIVDEPVRKPKTWMCISKVEGKKAVLYISADSLSSLLQPGDSLQIRADLQKVDADYLKKKGIAARGFVSAKHWKKTGRNQSFNFHYRSLETRNKMLKTLRQIVPKDELYLVAAALLTGYRDELSPELRRTFSVTGTSHILAISGFHFSFIYGMLYFFFSFLGKSRNAKIIRQCIILPVMWMYAFVAGMEPSVVRAVTMLSVWGIGEAFFLRSFTFNTLGFTAFAMLLYNPLYLFHVGFQLSFSAVLSILVINPHLALLYQSRNPLLRYAWGVCSVSTSAQVGTMPFCIYYFNQFPLIFWVTNLFAIPLSSALLFLLPFSLLVHTLTPEFHLISIILNQTLNLFVSGLKYLESIPNALLEQLNFSFVDSILMLVYLILFVLFLIKKRIYYFCLAFLLVTVQLFHYFCLS